MRNNLWIGSGISGMGEIPILGRPVKPLTELIRKIFTGGEQGFAYDLNDLTTLYQDAGGTVPVTAAGQPVGLMLDKSKGLTLGPELVVNGDFGQGTSGFVATGGELSIVGGKLRITATSAGDAIFLRYYTDSSSTDFYKLETAFTKTTVNDIHTYIYGNGPYLIRDKQVIAKGTASFSELFAIWFFPNAIGEYVEFDFISVKKLAGNHAFQTVSASRPILQRNATTGAYYLAFDGADDFLVTNPVDFTTTDKVSLFAGVRKLQDGQFGTILEHGNTTDSDGSFTLKCASGLGYYMQCGGVGNRSLVVASGGGGAPRIDVVAVQMDRSKTDVSELKYAINTNTLASNSVEIESSGATGSFINLPAYIGRRSGTTLPFNGHLYSLICIGRLTTDIETVVLENSIAKNTGVTLNA